MAIAVTSMTMRACTSTYAYLALQQAELQAELLAPTVTFEL